MTTVHILDLTQCGGGADIYPFIAFTDWSTTAGAPLLAWRTPDEQTRGYLTWIERHAELSRSAGVPFWVFAQGMSGTWYRRIDGRVESRPLFLMPDLPRMRYQIWAAALLGARGIFFFVYHSSGRYPDDVPAGLAEWEYDVGLRTVEGQPTPALEGATIVARRLLPTRPARRRRRHRRGRAGPGARGGRSGHAASLRSAREPRRGVRTARPGRLARALRSGRARTARGGRRRPRERSR